MVSQSYSQNFSSLPLFLKWIQPINFFRKLRICERIFGKKLAANGICWIQTGSGIPWKLDLANPTHRWIVYGKYEGHHFWIGQESFYPPMRSSSIQEPTLAKCCST